MRQVIRHRPGSILILLSLVCLAGVLAPAAGASQLIDRNASGVRLEVNRKGEALLTYRAHGKLHHVLAWGALNAVPPLRGRPQVAFHLDYAGGWGKYHDSYWKTFKDACRPYDGSALAWFVVGCKAPDGSYWALQSWQRELPDYGVTPTAQQSVWELHLSHWTGPLADFSVRVNWAYRRFNHLFGTLTYNGAGVYGFKSTSTGQPLDSFGRNVYIDTFDSAYGQGWMRENSFLTHAGTGAFCYGFYPHGSRPIGSGQKYRATVEGPGVTPDVMWEGDAPGPYDPNAQAEANEQIRLLADARCRPV